LGSDAPAGAQYVAGDCQLVGGCANISDIVMKDEIFEMDEFAVDPERGAGIGELAAFYPSLADRRTGDALVEASEVPASKAGRIRAVMLIFARS
jgi:hypothetical protein